MNTRAYVEGQLAQFGEFSAEERALTLVVDGRRVEAELAELNSLACSFRRMAVNDPALADASIDRLAKVSQGLANRLNYLLEPIQPIEVDADACVVQLRSCPPQQEEGRRSYYELVVKKPGVISLSRYTKAPGEPRAVATALVTREVFCRLANDLCAASLP
ncbi:MAG: hypothetical protein K1X71_14045 [Pirellulales bacterium]|nr:hypothetical protein [Pirellulales bacterium]